jgi:hypothetical protein
LDGGSSSKYFFIKGTDQYDIGEEIEQLKLKPNVYLGVMALNY